MITALGGALSLYLGVCIIMVVEVLELFLNFFINCYAYLIKGKRLDKEKEAKASMVSIQPAVYKKPKFGGYQW